MSSLVNGVTGMTNGAATGAATGGSAGGGYGALIGGVLGGALGLGSGLLSSGGTSAAQQLDMLNKYYQPTKAGWSWAQLENQVAYEQYLKQLQSSAKISAETDLALSQQMNRLLPSSQVAGLRLAGINPILAVLGSGFSPIQASASVGGSGTSAARVPGGLSKPARHINSAGSAGEFAKILGGAIDAEIDNRRADTRNKNIAGENLQAQTGNLRVQNDLLNAQSDKVRAEASLIHEQANRTHADTQSIKRDTDWGKNGVLRFAMGLMNALGEGLPKEPVTHSSKSIPLPMREERDYEKEKVYNYWKSFQRAINDAADY